MPLSPDRNSRNWAMSVPATKALPPAPRNTTTRTLPSSRRRAQMSASCSYIRQVMALRASGRSNTTVAMPSWQSRRTSPSLMECSAGLRSGSGRASVAARPQGWKGDDFADGGCAGEQHHDPFVAAAEAARRRHAVFERLEEVGIEDGRILAPFARMLELLLENGPLRHRIIHLGKGVGDLHAEAERLEPLRNARVVGTALGQRRGGGGENDHGGVPDQCVPRQRGGRLAGPL